MTGVADDAARAQQQLAELGRRLVSQARYVHKHVQFDDALGTTGLHELQAMVNAVVRLRTILRDDELHSADPDIVKQAEADIYTYILEFF